MSYWGYPKYVSVGQKMAKAEKKLKQLRKKMPDIRPVIITGNSLARSWWAKSWNENLERYADYDNRIGRGRSYLRHGAVLDLKIFPGKVTALVMGSAANPYEITITIQPVAANRWQTIKKQCQGHLKSLQNLLAGKFPKTLAEIFFTQDQGLFPSPKAIRFQCSCPDSASMCKHIAATLYGVGARFDEDPSLFFTLRGVDTGELLTDALKGSADELLNKTKKKTAKVIDDADLSDLFGIDMDLKPDFTGKEPKASPKKTRAKKSSQSPKSPQPVHPPAKSKNIAKSPQTATALVASIIAAATSGVTIADLAAKTGYPKTKLYGIVHRLKQEGKIKNASQGVYLPV
ncbi:MAG: hypothetical protein V2B20_14115 [Pseudomonadota bacterium]